nr:MAG TPA: Bifunctional glutathionylspermidine synthetase/amidase [Caudoviricetes sp.]
MIPKAGDIVIFERHEKNWNYGHIGIIVSADNQGYKILEQNAGHGLGY